MSRPMITLKIMLKTFLMRVCMMLSIFWFYGAVAAFLLMCKFAFELKILSIVEASFAFAFFAGTLEPLIQLALKLKKEIDVQSPTIRS